jgi:CDP-diacylglycerol---glycerol-3-phosphate 3-phosphatidyltransferase
VIGSKVGHSLDPLLLGFYRLLFRGRGVSPNTLTLVGLFFSVLSFVAMVFRFRLWVAAVLLLVSGLFDLLDGAVARKTDTVTRFGGFLDSVLDRYSDLFVMLGLSVTFLYRTDPFFSTITFFAAIGVAIVPYARARAEAASIECRNGLLERPERVILLVVGLFFDVLKPIVIILAILTHFTVLQRVLRARSIIERE